MAVFKNTNVLGHFIPLHTNSYWITHQLQVLLQEGGKMIKRDGSVESHKFWKTGIDEFFTFVVVNLAKEEINCGK